MKRRTLATAAASVALAMALMCASARSQDTPAGDWTARHFPAAFEELFPMRLGDNAFIAVRVHRGKLNDLREYSIVFEDAPGPKSIRAVLREAQGSPLYQQLAALHTARPSASYDELKRELNIAVWNLSPERCPAVSAQFKAFQEVQFVRPRDEDEPERNPVLYEFNETLNGGGSVLEYMENRALPRWAQATHDALEACIAAGRATPAK